jgi:hypothetical protein
MYNTYDQHAEGIGKDHDEDKTGQSDDRHLHHNLWSVLVGCPSIELCISLGVAWQERSPTRRPMIPPAELPLLKADCQSGGMA